MSTKGNGTQVRSPPQGPERVMTVLGELQTPKLGAVLPHEHVMCDFIGAEQTGRHRYERTDVVAVMQPQLAQITRRGIRTFVDCTPAYIGRDVELLAELSRLTGLTILTNTGYYGASSDKFLPRHAFTESASQLAARWTREWREGIDGTAVRPGFIKTGVDRGSLSEIDRTLVRAAALAHLETGLTIACHTGEATAALEVLEVVRTSGVDPEALIVVHADGIENDAVRLQIAEAGAWVELDGVGAQSTEGHLRMIRALVAGGHIGRILLSQDAGWYSVGQPGGGTIRPFTAILDTLLPELRAQRLLTDEQIRQIMVDNPARAFRVAVRAVLSA